MKSAEVLANALRKEADRRHAMGDTGIAHDLRSAAGNVSSADTLLESSKRQRPRPNWGQR